MILDISHTAYEAKGKEGQKGKDKNEKSKENDRMIVVAIVAMRLVARTNAKFEHTSQ